MSRAQASIMLHPSMIISANHRSQSHWGRSPKTAALRQIGLALGKQLDPPGRKVLIVFTFCWLTRARRDSQNLQPTSKAITDGLKDAGLFPDDDDRYVQGPLCLPGDELSPEVGKRPLSVRRIQLTVTIKDPIEGLAA